MEPLLPGVGGPRRTGFLGFKPVLSFFNAVGSGPVFNQLMPVTIFVSIKILI